METSRPPRRSVTVRVAPEILRALRGLAADHELETGRLADLGEIVTDLVVEAFDRRRREREDADARG
jgi:hypothetical protein